MAPKKYKSHPGDSDLPYLCYYALGWMDGACEDLKPKSHQIRNRGPWYRFGSNGWTPTLYKCVWFGAMDGPKPYKFTKFGLMDGSKTK